MGKKTYGAMLVGGLLALAGGHFIDYAKQGYNELTPIEKSLVGTDYIKSKLDTPIRIGVETAERTTYDHGLYAKVGGGAVAATGLAGLLLSRKRNKKRKKRGKGKRRVVRQH